MKKQDIPKLKKETQKVILRIAELKIKKYKLNCTPQEYIKRNTQK